VFIRESDVLSRSITIGDYVIHVNPIVSNGEIPHRKWDTLLADIGFKSARENLDVMQSLRYYMRVSNYCNECRFIIPDSNQDQFTYANKLASFMDLIVRNKTIRNFAKNYTWILPIHGTTMFTYYVAVCTSLRMMGIDCIYGLPSLRATITTDYPRLDLIDCSKKPETCVYYNMLKYKEIIERDREARFHAMGCNMVLFTTYVRDQLFNRVISMDTMSYRRAPDNKLKVNGKYMCTDPKQCWEWFNVWLRKAISREPIKPKTNVLF